MPTVGHCLRALPIEVLNPGNSGRVAKKRPKSWEIHIKIGSITNYRTPPLLSFLPAPPSIFAHLEIGFILEIIFYGAKNCDLINYLLLLYIIFAHPSIDAYLFIYLLLVSDDN